MPENQTMKSMSPSEFLEYAKGEMQGILEMDVEKSKPRLEALKGEMGRVAGISKEAEVGEGTSFHVQVFTSAPEPPEEEAPPAEPEEDIETVLAKANGILEDDEEEEKEEGEEGEEGTDDADDDDDLWPDDMNASDNKPVVDWGNDPEGL